MMAELGVQSWDAEAYAKKASFVPDLGQSVLDLLSLRPGERVLDLGCGAGDLTQKLIASGASVIGVDASQSMVDHAKANGIDARLCDARSLPFNNEFDAVFSNAVLHWIREQTEVVAGVRRSLKPGGRFVGEFGGFGNVAAIASTLQAALAAENVATEGLNPWYNPTVAEYTRVLEDGGFRVTRIDLHWRPTPLPEGMETWLDMFAKVFFEPLKSEAQRKKVKQRVLSALAPNLRDEDGIWFADYVRLRFVAFAG